MKTKKKSIRLWAVVFWLLVWQGASMALAALYPHGALLLASPLSALARLGELAVTAAFWRTALTSATRILGGFLLACALAVVLAALAARYRRVEELLADRTGAQTDDLRRRAGLPRKTQRRIGGRAEVGQHLRQINAAQPP